MKLTYSSVTTGGPQTETIDEPFKELERFNPNFSIFETDNDSSIFNIDYELNDEFKLRNKLSYSDTNVRRLAPPGAGEADMDFLNLTHEAILTYTKAKFLSGLLGVYYLSSTLDQFIDLTAFRLGPGNFDDRQNSLDIFGEVTLTPID